MNIPFNQVGCVGAFDRDAQGTKNSELRFEMRQPGNAEEKVPFRADADTGCMFLELAEAEPPLDFEQREMYNFSIKVRLLLYI
jgi:hypothetical protein